MSTAVAEHAIVSRIGPAYERLAAAASMLESPFLLAIRLYWGWQFAETGWGKLQHLPKVTNFFTSLGIPFPAANAVFVSWLEFVGGILLAVGFLSRPLALLLVIDMLVAYVTAGRDDLLAFFSNPGKFYGNDAFTFLFASLIVFIFGPGKWSVDAFKWRKP
jgi:putative oxidoreductase